MTHIVPIVSTQDSITIVVNGKPFVSKKGDMNFDALKEAIDAKDYDKAVEMATNPKFIEKWSQGYFKWTDDHVFFRGEVVPKNLEERMFKVARLGNDPSSLMRFWENLQENPSYRSVQQLYRFLEHKNIPITLDGHLLAYKGVNEDYTDCHTSTFVNKPGAEIYIDRNKVDDDPNKDCSKGFHIGDLSYATGFGAKTVICKIHPRDVVSIPHSDARKMRVCRYTVVGDYNGKPLPSTVIGFEAEPKTLPDENIEPVEEVDRKPVARPKSAQQKLDLPDPDFDKLSAKSLGQISLGKLRKYATRIGVERASKLPGGKPALIHAIVTQRNVLGSKAAKARHPKAGKEANAPKKTEAKAAKAQVKFAPLDTKLDKAKVSVETKTLMEALKGGIDEKALDRYSTKVLRKFAAGIGMTGASKIPGGKPKLIEALLGYIKRHPSL